MVRFRSEPPQSLQEVLKDFLDDIPYRKRLKRGMILSLWNETVGAAIAKRVRDIYFEHSNLIIHVKNPVWRHEIHMNRFRIARELNEKVGEKVINEIVVRS